MLFRALTELQGLKAAGSDQLSLRRAINYFLDNLARQTERQETIGKIGEVRWHVGAQVPGGAG